MAKQRIKKVQVSAKLEEAFPRFVASATARGVSDKTIQNPSVINLCPPSYHEFFYTFVCLLLFVDYTQRIV